MLFNKKKLSYYLAYFL